MLDHQSREIENPSKQRDSCHKCVTITHVDAKEELKVVDVASNQLLRLPAAGDQQAQGDATACCVCMAQASIQYTCRLLRGYGINNLTPEVIRQAKFDAPAVRT